MDKKTRILALALAALLTLGAFAAAAPRTGASGAKSAAAQYAADPGQGAVYRLKNGRKVALSCSLAAARVGGNVKYYYAIVSTENDPDKVPVSGAVFFGTNGRQTKFIPVENAVSGLAVSPSPDGMKFVLSIPEGESSRINRVYIYSQMRPLTSVRGSALDWSGPSWTDERRFAYTAYDDTKMKKPGASGSEAGYTSVCLYDTVSRRSRVLAPATPTDEYVQLGYRDGFVLMGHYFVDTPEQWAEGIESNEHLKIESNYVWLPDWKPGSWWKNPAHTFLIDELNERVVMLGADGRSELKTALHKGTFRDSVEQSGDAGGVPYYWFIASEKDDPRLKDEVPLVYVFAGQEDMNLCAVIPAAEPERVRDVSISPAGERLIVVCGEEGSQLHDLELYKLTLREHEGALSHQFTLRPTYGAFYWIDPWRVAYSRLNLEAELKSGREPGYALDAFVYDAAVGEDAQITESSTADSYQVMGLTDDGSIWLDQITVPDFADWKDPAKERRTRLKGRIPAAG
ncbi:MAG: hypothetical protein IJ822_08800 [Pyramidobacter sp.]|nr:hypothetical protein [Pyramidobacter sp.]